MTGCMGLLTGFGNVSRTRLKVEESMGRGVARARGLASLARNSALAGSVAWRHAGRAGSQVASVALRAAPRQVRGGVVRSTTAVGRPDLAALAVAASGDRARARELLAQTLTSAPATPGGNVTRRRVASAAVTLHEPTLADRALEGCDPDDLHVATLRALVAAGNGHLEVALELARAAPGQRGRSLAKRIEGECEVLRHTVLDEVPLAATRRSESRQGADETQRIRRVLHVVTNALPETQAGYTLRTHGIASAQSASGLDVHVVTRLGFPVDTGHLTAEATVERDGVTYHRLLPRGPVPLPSRDFQERHIDHLIRLMEEMQPDVVHAHSKHENGQVALVAAQRLGIPVVYEARGFLEETWRSRGGSPDTDFYRWSRHAETACMQRADAVITLAHTMREQIIERGVDADRVHVVPNAVSDGFFEGSSERAATRAELGIGDGETVFGIVSTLNDYEGIDVLIEALYDAPQGARLLIVGDGPARESIAAAATPLGERVVMTGRVPHERVRSLLAAMDAFCVPRRRTPVTELVPPLKPLEAMAAGLPLIVSDLPPLVECVRPGRAEENLGLVATPGDAQSWAEAIATLHGAPSDARARGQLAHDWVAKHGTWGHAADRYDRIYASTGAGRQPGTAS